MTRKSLFLLALLLSVPLLAQNADLRVSAEADSYKAAIGDLVGMRVRIDNQGPGAAANARATVTVPPGMTILAAQVMPPFAAACTTAGDTATCNFGELPTVSFTMFVNLRMPETVGTFEVTSRVSSDTPDPDPGNNVAITSIETEARTNLWVFVNPLLSRVDPGEVVELEARMTNSPATVPGTRFVLDIRAENGTIEWIVAPAWQCSVEGDRAQCVIDAPTSNCCIDEPLQIAIRTNPDPRGGQTRVTIHPSASVPGEVFAPGEAIIDLYRHIAVTSTADSGPGTLRAAFEEVNESCAETPCKIDFALAGPVPDEGWFTITPETPLPAIHVPRVIIDATTQTKLTGDTNPRGPEVAIDGRIAGQGLEIHAHCQAAVRGFTLGNFLTNQALWMTQDRRGCSSGDRPLQFVDGFDITANHIGVDPTGAEAWPNLRGLRLDDAGGVHVVKNVISRNRFSGVWMWRGAASFRENVLQRNGASGIFFGPEVQWGEVLANVIDGHPHMGVAIARGARYADVRGNSMRANFGLGIDWGLDGPSPIVENDTDAPSNPPVLLSAVYDPAADETRVTMTLQSRPLAPFAISWVINLYTNDAPDGDGEKPVAERQLQPLPAQPFVVAVRGNHEGKWINATSSRVRFNFFSRPGEPRTNAFAGGDTMTSELSNSVLVTR